MKIGSLIYGLRSILRNTKTLTMRILMMIKNILAAVFFTFISYAIVSSIGQPQHSYRMPIAAAISD